MCEKWVCQTCGKEFDMQEIWENNGDCIDCREENRKRAIRGLPLLKWHKKIG